MEVPTCAGCRLLGAPPIDSGLRYCDGRKTWQWPTDRVELPVPLTHELKPCHYRQPRRKRKP